MRSRAKAHRAQAVVAKFSRQRCRQSSSCQWSVLGFCLIHSINSLRRRGVAVNLRHSSPLPIQNGNSSRSSAASCHCGYRTDSSSSLCLPVRLKTAPVCAILASRNQISRSTIRAQRSGSTSSLNIARGGPARIACSISAKPAALSFGAKTTSRRMTSR